MSANPRFVDTNVILYAHDMTAGDKHSRARALLQELWDSRDGCISIQVLQEFYVNATRKIAKPLDVSTAKEVIADMSHWHTHTPAADDVLGAISIQQHSGISFWDAMVVRSAAELGCQVLYSEDLNHGQSYCGVRVENPFQVGPEGLHGYRQVGGAAEVDPPVPLHVPGCREVGEPPHEALDGDPRLQPGQRSTQAVMRSSAE
jgi:predicted nucleic acid-binding protein